MNKDSNKQLSKKLQLLWQDKRNYKTRLLIAMAASFVMCFTFIFFGPIELTAFGQDSLTFHVFDVLYIMAMVAIVSFVIISLVVSMFKGRIFNYIVTAIFSITICGYIQGNFLNGQLGALTGDAIDWHLQRTGMLINLLVWLIIFIIPYIVLYLHKKGWKNMIYIVSSALVIMQLVALITVFMNPPVKKEMNSKDVYLTTHEIVEYSKENNTLVFLLDRLDYDYVQQVLDDDSHFFDKFDGFTSYTNATSEHTRTRPAANYMLTNCEELLYKVPAQKYFEDSWNHDNKNILEDLNKAGYKSDVYTQIGDMFGSGKSVENLVSNLSTHKRVLDNMGVASELVGLSMYRYAPISIKPFFWTYTDYVNKNAYVDSQEDEKYVIDEVKYSNKIEDMSLNENDKYFKFYHFNGSHPPYVVNENGTKSSSSTSVVQQTKGNFQILFHAFQKMKELGIYKDASIIIVADHGDSITDYKPLQKATRIGLFYKPSGEEGSALKQSQAPVSLRNIPATLLRDSGIDYSKYGKALDEVKENEDILRVVYKTVMKDGHEKELYTYEVTGDASDFKNWKIASVDTIEYPYY